MIRPLGNMVLIKAKKVEQVSSGGIILPEDLTKKEQSVESTGEVVAFGPAAFQRWKGCESPDWLQKSIDYAIEGNFKPGTDGLFAAICEHFQYHDPDNPPNKQWGVEIGDLVEHRRYEAKDSVFETEDGEIYRYIPDVDIIGVIEQ